MSQAAGVEAGRAAKRADGSGDDKNDASSSDKNDASSSDKNDASSSDAERKSNGDEQNDERSELVSDEDNSCAAIARRKADDDDDDEKKPANDDDDGEVRNNDDDEKINKNANANDDDEDDDDRKKKVDSDDDDKKNDDDSDDDSEHDKNADSKNVDSDNDKNADKKADDDSDDDDDRPEVVSSTNRVDSSEAFLPTNALAFAGLVGQNKWQKRSGWIPRGVRRPESVADHQYRMAMLAFLAPEVDEQLDVNRCIQLALVHDLAESIVGDIYPAEGVSKEDKHNRERMAFDTIASTVSRGSLFAYRRLPELFDEYEARSSREARFVKDLDSFEMLLQAYEYETAQAVDLSDFFDANPPAATFHYDAVRSWYAELLDHRNSQAAKRLPARHLQPDQLPPCVPGVFSFGAASKRPVVRRDSARRPNDYKSPGFRTLSRRAGATAAVSETTASPTEKQQSAPSAFSSSSLTSRPREQLTSAGALSAVDDSGTPSTAAPTTDFKSRQSSLFGTLAKSTLGIVRRRDTPDRKEKPFADDVSALRFFNDSAPRQSDTDEQQSAAADEADFKARQGSLFGNWAKSTLGFGRRRDAPVDSEQQQQQQQQQQQDVANGGSLVDRHSGHEADKQGSHDGSGKYRHSSGGSRIRSKAKSKDKEQPFAGDAFVVDLSLLPPIDSSESPAVADERTAADNVAAMLAGEQQQDSEPAALTGLTTSKSVGASLALVGRSESGGAASAAGTGSWIGQRTELGFSHSTPCATQPHELHVADEEIDKRRRSLFGMAAKSMGGFSRIRSRDKDVLPPPDDGTATPPSTATPPPIVAPLSLAGLGDDDGGTPTPRSSSSKKGITKLIRRFEKLSTTSEKKGHSGRLSARSTAPSSSSPLMQPDVVDLHAFEDSGQLASPRPVAALDLSPVVALSDVASSPRPTTPPHHHHHHRKTRSSGRKSHQTLRGVPAELQGELHDESGKKKSRSSKKRDK